MKTHSKVVVIFKKEFNAVVGNCWQKQLLKVTNIFKSQAKFNKQIILTTVYRFQQTSPESNECTHKNENTWGAGVVSWKKKWSSGNSLIYSLKTDMWSVMLDLYNCRSLSRWKLKLLTPISCLKPWRCFWCLHSTWYSFACRTCS